MHLDHTTPREEDVNWLGLVISSTQMFRSFFEGRNSRDGAVTNPKGKEDTSEPACPSPS